MVKLGAARFAIVVNDDNAVYPILIDPLTSLKAWTQTQSGAKFGFAVSPYGSTFSLGTAGVMVGAPYFDTGSYVDAGKVFVFVYAIPCLCNMLGI